MPDGSGGIRKKARLGKLRRRRSSVGLMALEPRLMYDGAGAATAAAAAHHHHHDHDGSSSSGSGQAASPHADAGSSTWQNNSPSATNAWRHDHEHVAPAVTTGMPSASFAGGGSAVTLDSGLTLSGGDRNGNLASATVSISGGFASGDTLSFANQNGITGSYDSATGVLTLTGTSSVANYQTALESITYSSTAVDPSNGGTDASRTISWGTSDGSHRNGTSGTATSTVAVYAPPQLGAGASTTYTSGDAAVTLDAGLTLSDPASATLSSATVAIASGFLAGDALSFTSQNGITGSYNSATGVLTLTGTSSVANYQAALASVTFKSLASDATSGGTNIDRTIAWTINDGANLASAASTVAVAAALLPGGSSGQQIVFIDGNVPDAQALAQGVQPGITVVILDPNANGVQEMADYLTENNVQNLAAIQIVSHGEDATVRLGNTIFGLADIGMFSQQLATIGSALQPGGDILFYGCNVGAGTEGLLFEVELSLATGGAHIAAASHDVGAAALGGSWTLDVTDAGIDVGNPFTATTLANYQGLLTNKIWFSQSTNSGGTSDGVFNATYLGSNPSATVSPSSVENQQQYTTFGIDYTGVQGIAVDPASGFYYAATNSALGGLVVRGSISGGTPTIIYQNTNDDTVYGVAYNSATNTVYFAQEDANAVNFPTASTTDSGIYAITSASTLTAQSGTSAATKVITTDATIPNYIAVDSTDNLIFWTNNAASASFSNDPSTLNVAPLNSSTSIGTITTLKTYTDSADNVFAGGIALDTVNHKIYWTTYNFGGSGSTGSYNDVYAASYNSATGALGTITTLYTDSSSDLNRATTGIAIDVPDYAFFVTNDLAQNASSPSTTSSQIIEGNLTTANQTPTVIYTTANNVFIGFDATVVAPVVTASGTVTFTGGGSAVTLDSGLTIAQGNYGNLTGATVTVGSAVSGDTLNFSTQNGITGSYNSTSHVLTLSGTASVANYQTALDSITYSFSPSNGDPTGGGATVAHSISWQVTDAGGSTSTAATSTLDSTHVAPVVTAGTPSVTFNGGGSAVTIDSGLTLSDVDSGGNLSSATISISSGHVSGDTLNFSTQNGITGSYNSSLGTLTLTGTATVAQYQTALESITYSFSPSNGDPTSGGGVISRTFHWVVSDGNTSTGTSNTGSSSLTVTHVAPTVTAGASVTAISGGSAVTLDSGLTVSDVDSAGNLSSATISITSGFQSGDVLHFTNQNSITGSYNSGTGVLTLTGSDTLAHYQTALESITYSTSATGTSRTVTWTANDGSTSNGTGSATSSITVQSGPTVTAGASVSFNGGGAAVTLDGALTVTDAGSTTLSSVTVSISSGFQSGDLLNFTNQNSITGSYNSTTGVLTLTGSDTLAHYQTALDSITYSFNPSNGDPTVGGSHTSRTINWLANDGSNTGSATSSLTTVHVAPVVTPGTPSVTFNGGGSAVTIDSGLTLSDVDSGGNLSSATISISSGHVSGDTLNFSTQNGITGSYNSSLGTLTLTGTATVAQYQTALESITYSFSPSNGDPTSGGGVISRTFHWVVSDGNTSTGTSNTGSSTISVVHTAPVVTAGSPSVTFNGGGSAVTLDSGLTLSDVDSGGNLTAATVTISSGLVAGDTLNFTNQNGITGSYNSGTGVLTLTGTATVANYQTALESITYSFSPSNGDPTGGSSNSTSRTVQWVASDGSSSNGTSNTGSTSLSVVHTAPVVTAGTPSVTFNGGGSAVTLDSGLTLSDVDSGGNLTGATITISSGLVSGDTLNFSTQNGITGSYNSGTGVLTLTGTSSVAHYQTALESITYSFSPSNGDPTNGGGATSRSLSWVVSDGATSNGTSNTGSTSLGVVHVAPVVTAGSPSATFNGGGSAVTLDNGLTLSDVDSGGNLSSATVTISANLVSGDTLNFSNQNNITGSYNSATGVLTLTGTDTVAHYQTALDSITYSFSPSNGDPTSGGGSTSRTIQWVVSDGSTSNGTSNTGSTSLSVVHTAPVVTAGTPSVTFNGGGSAVTLDSGLTLSDGDSAGNLQSATISISANLVSGDTLNFTNQNGISGSYNSGTGVLTLTGTSSVANYQTALESITYSFSPSNGDPTSGGGSTSRTIGWMVSDGSSSNGTSNTGSTSLSVAHTGPVVTAGTPSVTFNGGGSAVTLDSGLTLSDVDSAGNLQNATVSISSGLVSGDTLNFSTQNGISGSYNSTTGVLTLSGTSSVANYQTALESITYSFSPSNGDPTGGGTGTSRTLHWVVSDGSSSNGTSNTGSTSLTVAHTPPSITAGVFVTYNAGGSAATLDGGLTLSDVDSGGNLQNASVVINTGFLSGDTLNFINQNGISGSYDGTSGVLTLTGTASVANYQTALRSVTYSSSVTDPTSGGTDNTRQITWVVFDGSTSNGQNSADSQLNVTAGPNITAGATVTYTSGGSAVTLDGPLTVTDPSSTTLANATVAITGGTFLSGDTLSFTNQNGITGSYNSATGVLTLTGTDTLAHYQAAGESATITIVGGTGVSGDVLNFTNQNGITGSYVVTGSLGFIGGVLTLSGSASVADYQTALDSITFSSSNADATFGGSHHTRTITWQVQDSLTSSNSATTSLTVNAPPVVTAGASATYNVGGSATQLDAALTVTDTEATNLSSATAAITSGFLSGDTLNFSTQNGISGSYNSSTGVLTLTGTASTANYQTALDSITYSSTAADPGNAGANLSRTITWTANDGTTAGSATSSLTVHARPTVTAGGSATFNGGGSAVTLDGTLTVADVSSSTLSSATISIGSFVSGDKLNFTNQNGITGSYDSTSGVLTLTGSATTANYQTALDSITYIFNPGNGDPTAGGGSTSRTISWTVSDGSTTSSPAATSSLTTVHVAPVVTAGSPSVTFNGGGSAVTLDNILTLSDADSAGNLTGATVTISSGLVSGDTLNFTNQNNITGSYNSATGVLTLAGSDTIGHYRTALQSITYSFSPSNGDPTGGAGNSTSRTVQWVVADGSTSNGTSNTGSTSLSVVHTAPTVTAGATASYTGAGSAVTLDGGLTVSDVDSGGNLASATVSIGSGFTSGDTLTFSNQNGITGSYNSSTGVLTLSGTSSVANYQTALDSITYSFSPSSGNATSSSASRTINWVVNDGSSSNATNSTATSTLNITHVAPTVTAGGSATFTGGGSAVTLDSGITVTDIDSGNLLTGATVAITSGFTAGDTLSTNTTGVNITASYNSTTGVLSLSGVETVTDYKFILSFVQYSFSPGNGDPTVAGSDTSRTISWSVQDGSVSNNTSTTDTSSLTTVHVAPALTAGSPAVTYSAGGSAATLDSVITLSDVDSGGNLASATVSITSGFLSGDTLNFSTQNGITGSYNSSTGVLTLTGSASIASYQTALQSITFSNGGADITSGGADHTRSISWVVSDGSTSNGSSNTGTTSLTVNAPPIVTAGASVTYNAGGSASTLDGALTVTDSESTTLTGATVSISSGFLSGDTLNFITQNGITGSYNSSTGVLTLTGTASTANYQTALESITYTSSAADPTNGGADLTRTITWTPNDGTTTASATSTLHVQTPPVVTAGASATYNAGGSVTTLDSALSLTDSESTTVSSATISITSGFLSGDTLGFTNQSGITGSYNSGTGVLTLTGSATVAQYKTALESITFSSSSGDASNGGTDNSRTLSWSVNDGTSSSNTATSSLTVNGPAPTLSGTTAVTTTYIQSGTSAVLDAGVTAADVDKTTLSGATVSITSGFLAGDTLTASTTGTTITASYNSATGVLTLSGTDTIAHYNSVLQAITYSSTSEPTNGGADFARTVSWQVNDGKTGNNLSSVATTSIDVHALPVVTAGGSMTFTAGGGPILVDATVGAADVDSNPITTATVKISTGLTTGDVLAFNAGANTQTFTDGSTITGSYNSTTGVLTLTGSVGPAPSTADFQAALRTVTFDNPGATSGSAAEQTQRTLSWTLGTSNVNQTSAISTSTVVPPAPAPTNTGGATPMPLSGDDPTDTPSNTNSNTPGSNGPTGNGPTSNNNQPGPSPPVTSPTSSPFGGPAPGFVPFVPGSLPGLGLPGLNIPGQLPVFTMSPGSGPDGGGGAIDPTFGTFNTSSRESFETPATMFAATSTDELLATVAKDGQGQAEPRAVARLVADNDRPVPETGHRDVSDPDFGLDRPMGTFEGAAVHDVPLPEGKISLSAQLRAAGRQGFINERQAFLNSLRHGPVG